LKTSCILLCLTLAGACSLAAQTPSINAGGIVNAASYAYAGLPSGGITPGSIFAVFGSNLGPAQFAQSGAYPLPTTLGGTSVKVTSGSTTAQAYLFLSSASQLTAMLPSSIPAGTASLTVTYSGATSAAQTFTVAASSFGIFASNSGGSGPGVITNANSQVYGLTTSANPDDAAVIWGTGLTAVTGNEAGGALPGDLPNLPVEVYVGDTKATVTYRGRSGCCAGLDQIVFTVPAVTGCRVPVTVKISSIVSNNTTIAIAAKGSRTCSDPGGPSAADLNKYTAQGNTSIGVVTLARTSTSISVPGFGSITTNADVGGGSFLRYTAQQLDSAQNPFGTELYNSCTVSYFKGASATASDPTLPKYLDAGTALTVSGGAGGTKQLTKSTTGGIILYSGLLSTIGATGSTGYLDPGNYTVTGPAGPDVGGFTAKVTIPGTLAWTNQAALTDVTRASGQSVSWTVSGDPNGYVLIGGSSASGTDANAVGANFTCFAKNSAGQYTIPAATLLALPPSAVVAGVPTGVMYVGLSGTPQPFTASGVDLAYIVYTSVSAKTLNFK